MYCCLLIPYSLHAVFFPFVLVPFDLLSFTSLPHSHFSLFRFSSAFPRPFSSFCCFPWSICLSCRIYFLRLCQLPSALSLCNSVFRNCTLMIRIMIVRVVMGHRHHLRQQQSRQVLLQTRNQKKKSKEKEGGPASFRPRPRPETGIQTKRYVVPRD